MSQKHSNFQAWRISVFKHETAAGSLVAKKQRYRLCSTKLNAETHACVVGSTAEIESGVSGKLAVAFPNDHVRLGYDRGSTNLATIKQAVMNRLHTPNQSPA